MKNYVIIGNGVAAAGCIEGIRSIDKDGKITVISSENHPVYCRPLISYYLEGKTTLQKMSYRADDFYEKNGCEVLYGKTAASIDPDAKTVVLESGEKISFDSVCIASGSNPFVPPMEGLDKVEKRFSFMTMDDATSLESAITPKSRVLIVGAGLIGLKCAEGLHERVKSITVCDLADTVMSSILDKDSASMVEANLKNHGITLMLGDTVSKFDGNTAIMRSGAKVEFDVLVVAVGVRAATKTAISAGCRCERGIVVNTKMETSVPGVYAAGDCTQSYDIASQTEKVMAIMPNAYMQGVCAGKNMAGSDSDFDNAIPMNSIGFFEQHVMTAGSYSGEVYEEKTQDTLKKLYVRDGRLVGFIIIGCTDRVGIYTNLIRNKTPLDTVDFESLKVSPELYLLGREYCKSKLGGVI